MKINNKTNISLLLKREIRKSVGARSNLPIKIINGNSPPKLVGNTYHYQNKSGDVIRYPNAYKKACGKPIYIHSTQRVEVGADWLLNDLSLFNLKMWKLRIFS